MLNFIPTSSAAVKAIPKRNAPLPSFHARPNVSGYAIKVNRIGAIRISVTTILELIPNNL
jgi:hypothetical protein